MSASRRRRSRAARRSASSSPRNCRGAPPGAPSTSWMSRPPDCISRMSKSSSRCCTPWSTPATRSSSSSTTSKSSRPPTGSSIWGRRGAIPAATSSPPARRRTSPPSKKATPAGISARISPASRRGGAGRGDARPKDRYRNAVTTVPVMFWCKDCYPQGPIVFKSKTVFVLGAGASQEAGLPIGSELKQQIAERLHITFEDGYREKSGDRLIVNTLMAHARNLKIDANDFLHECRFISRAVTQALSIDHLLEAHEGNDKLELCAKLAIALEILEAEARSKLKFDEIKLEGFSPSKLNSTWYENLFMLLNENVKVASFENLFRNISFIIFNYDRCLEHFLYHSVQNYYRVTGDASARLIESIVITHPYGAVGKLPWQVNGNTGIGFGIKPQETKLLEIAGQIKTFTERVEDDEARSTMRSQIR